jgi:hypothetical protein
MMILKDIVGIMNLNGQADLYEEGMSTPLCFTLCKLLLQHVLLSDGCQLLAEIYQSSDVMGRVQAVIPNTPEAEQMVLMMNKNFPAYMGHVLHDQGLPKTFLMEIFRRSCCPTMMSEMALCTWDPDSGVLTTSRESAKNHNLAELEKVAWHKDAFEDLGAAKQGGLKPPPQVSVQPGQRPLHQDHPSTQQQSACSCRGWFASTPKEVK